MNRKKRWIAAGALAVAVEHTGDGTVTETEVGDDDGPNDQDSSDDD